MLVTSLLIIAAAGGAGSLGEPWVGVAQRAAPSQQPEQASDPDLLDDADEESTTTEVVVRGRRERRPIGAVVGPVKPELQLLPAEIQSYGVPTLSELLDEIAPQSRTGRSGGPPAVLLNGRRISGFGEVASLPVEAILRIDILPEQVALTYGFAPDQRVVNVVLRGQFRALAGRGAAGGPTQGGAASGSAEFAAFRIRGDSRMNFDLNYKGSSRLLESSRDLTSGAHPEPASDMDGSPPTTVGLMPAAIISSSGWRGARHDTLDLSGFRTLLPETQSVTANGVWARPLSKSFSATTSVRLGVATTESWLGFSALTTSEGGAVTPNLALGWEGGRRHPSAQNTTRWTTHLGGILNRDRGRWRQSLTGVYDRVNDTTSTTAASLTGHRLELSASDRAPPLAQSRARSKVEALNGQLLFTGPLLEAPAGQLFASFRGGANVTRLESRSDQGQSPRSENLSRTEFNGQASFDLPLANRRYGVLPLLGDLLLNANLAVNELSDFGLLQAYGYGVNWRPRDRVTLIFSDSRVQAAPTVSQLGEAVITTPGAPVFDFVTGQTVGVTRISGGSNALQASERELMKLAVNWRPWLDHGLTFVGHVLSDKTQNIITTLPALTAELQAALPERFTRNAEGQLTAVDFRPVNFARRDRTELRYGLNYSRLFNRKMAAAIQRLGKESQPVQLDFSGATPVLASAGGSRGQGGLQLALYHTVVLEDRILVTQGGPTLDFLEGSAAGEGGGQPRHELEVQAGFSMRGFGARLSADWRGGTVVRGGPASGAGTLTYSDLATVNLRLFANLGSVEGLRGRAWAKGTRVALDFSNLLDQRLTVRDSGGATPLFYPLGPIDPLGRVVTISLRKLLL